MQLRRKAYPVKTRPYEADASYGVLDVGEVFSLTSESLGLTDHLVELIRKRWNGVSWDMQVTFSDDPLRK